MNWISLNSMIRKWFRRKPLNVLEGGTGANTFEKACENLGAVKKTGDVITGTFEYQGIYEEKDAEDNIVTTVTHQHPIVNVPGVSEGGMDVVVESVGTRPLFLGSSEQAGKVRKLLLPTDDDADATLDVDNNLYLASGDSMRFYSGITTEGNNANGLREAMRLNTSGNLVIYPNYAEGKEYNAFQVRNSNDNEEFIGSVRTSVSKVVSEKDKNKKIDEYKIGLYTLSKNSQFANRVAIGVNDEGHRTVQLGYGSSAWRAALMDIGGKGYGTTASSNSKVAEEWGKWIRCPWKILENVIDGEDEPKTITNVPSNKGGNEKVARYIIPADLQEVLIFGRAQNSPYNYGSSLILPRNVITSLDATTGKIFMLGGGWNSSFGGDAAKIRLTYGNFSTDPKDTRKVLVLRVLGVSVGGNWINNSWVFYHR